MTPRTKPRSKPRIVVTGEIPTGALDLLRGIGDVWVYGGEVPIGRPQLLREVAGADAVVTLLTERVDAELLDAAGSQLKVVANVAVGYNNVDVPTCTDRGVAVTNTPGVLTDATADLAMALILMVTRRLGEGERQVRSGQPWKWAMDFMLGTGIQGRQLGIVGMGAIGTGVAHRARVFGMSVVYNNRSRVDVATEAALGAQRLELEELLATSDIVSLHLPYSPETHHLINADRLALMKPTAYLVNTARGPIVDEAALAAALTKRTIAGAGLDVFEHEPEVTPTLLELDNVVLTPHLGSATVETRSAMAMLAARNVTAVLAGQPPLTPVVG